MNDHFINVKVDREERPDVDKVYMSFVQASTGGGGWPMSVFLTPQLKPVFGGTYFPPGTKELLGGLFFLWTLKTPLRMASRGSDLNIKMGQNTQEIHHKA